MSLARLLAAGKSVVGISSGETRYRMHPKRLLPKFGSARNPFEAKPGETEAVAPAAVLASAPVERVESFAAGATPLAAAVVAPTVANLPGASAASPVSGGQDSRWVRWRQRLARAAGWGKPQGQSPFGGTPVQSELKLEAVKVVRNDLSGAPDDLFGRRAASQELGSETTELTPEAPFPGLSRGSAAAADRPPAFAVRSLLGLWPRPGRDRAGVGMGLRQRA